MTLTVLSDERIARLNSFLLSPAFIVFVTVFTVNIFVSWFWFSTYRIWNFDLAWQTQVVESYAEMREPIVSMIGEGFNALGNHFSPILALAAPVFALFPQSFTLNVLMAFCFALSAGILAASATKLLSSKSAYLIGVGLGVSWGFLTASSAGFHEYALGAPILAYALAKLIEGNYFRAAVVASFLVFVKEDVGILLIGLGIVMAMRARSWKWLLLSAWGGFWVFFTIKVFIPAISGVWTFSSFVELSPVTLFTDVQVKLFLVLFLIFQLGVIGLRSPLAYILIPILAPRLFSSWSSFYEIGYHYDTLTIVIASFALLDALSRYEWKTPIRVLAISTPLFLTIIYLLLPMPGSNNSYLTRDYSDDAQVIAAHQGAFDFVPKGAIVSANNATVAGFIDRGYITYFNRSNTNRMAPDCIVNETEDILGAGGEKISSISELGKEFGREYELSYDTDYVKVWCHS